MGGTTDDGRLEYEAVDNVILVGAEWVIRGGTVDDVLGARDVVVCVVGAWVTTAVLCAYLDRPRCRVRCGFTVLERPYSSASSLPLLKKFELCDPLNISSLSGNDETPINISPYII